MWLLNVLFWLLLALAVVFFAFRLLVRFSNRRCVFCEIARGSRSAKIVFRTEDTIVFHDVRPQGELHLLAVPEKHVADVHQLKDVQVLYALEKAARKALEAIGEKRNADLHFVRPPFNTVFHLHLHIIVNPKGFLPINKPWGRYPQMTLQDAIKRLDGS